MKKDFLSFGEARKIVLGLGFKNKMDYIKNHPSNLPHNPNIYYGKEWDDWFYWLGTSKQKQWKRKYFVNDDFFKTWSADMAYVLGLWWSDGHIFPSKNRLSICQHKKDKEILEKVLIKMDSNYLVKTYGNICRFDMVSSTIVNDIKKLGGEERKSLVCKFPDVSDKYLPDLLRGLWDGDGSIWYSSSSCGYRSNLSSGSKDFILEAKRSLENKVVKHCVYKEYIREAGEEVFGQQLQKDSTTYQIVLGPNDTRKLFDFMYYQDNLIKMERKYNLFKEARLIRIPKGPLPKNFLQFTEAKDYARGLNLSGRRQWHKHCKENGKPFNIPSSPDTIYKDKGWVNWMDWLGNE